MQLVQRATVHSRCVHAHPRSSNRDARTSGGLEGLPPGDPIFIVGEVDAACSINVRHLDLEVPELGEKCALRSTWTPVCQGKFPALADQETAVTRERDPVWILHLCKVHVVRCGACACHSCSLRFPWLPFHDAVVVSVSDEDVAHFVHRYVRGHLQLIEATPSSIAASHDGAIRRCIPSQHDGQDLQDPPLLHCSSFL